MIVRWPGRVAPGALTHEVGHVVDFMPTFMELAGVSYADLTGDRKVMPQSGRSLVPVLKGDPAPPRDEMLCWALMGSRAVRDGDWKLVWGASDQRWELYKLDTDRSESTDLAAVHPARVQRMASAWNQWAVETEVQEL